MYVPVLCIAIPCTWLPDHAGFDEGVDTAVDAPFTAAPASPLRGSDIAPLYNNPAPFSNLNLRRIRRRGERVH